MSTLVGITGAIGSGKSTIAQLLADIEPNHAHYETNQPIIEIADEFNTALHAELSYKTTNNDIEIINQVLMWLTDAIYEHTHVTTTWKQIAITPHGLAANPNLYVKLLEYLAIVKKHPNLLTVPITKENKSDYRALLQWLGAYFIVKLNKHIWEKELMRRIQQRDANKKLVIISGIRYPAQAEFLQSHGGIIVHVERPGLATADSNDPTEAQRDQIAADTTIVNSGELADLQRVCTALWSDIATNSPRHIYSTSV